MTGIADGSIRDVEAIATILRAWVVGLRLPRANALDKADPDARTIPAILDRIEGAFEEAQRSLQEGLRGEGTRIEDL